MLTMRRLALTLVTVAMLALPGAAIARDRDHDGLPDRWERKHDLSTKKRSANGDPDRDRVDNGNEFRERTDPRDRDSDSDGRRDGREDADRDKLSNADEDATGNDPRNPDTDDDGTIDGREQAGVVAGFADGVLTIDLANGDSIAGSVTEETRITCSSEAQAERRHRGRGRKRGGARKAQAGEDDPIDPGEENEDDPPSDDEDGPLPGEEPDDTLGPELGEDEPGSGGDKGAGGRSCPESSLRRGVAVHEAVLVATPEGVFFKSVELVR
jgi:hypothetical protein